MGLFVLKRETNFCTVHIDEVGRATAADQGYVVNCHQKFGAKERSIGRAKDQNSANHREGLLLGGGFHALSGVLAVFLLLPNSPRKNGPALFFSR